MATVTFPSNPSDGMIFEALPGLFYQYDASSNSWIRIDKADGLPDATPLQDGLMTSEDLEKVMNLVIPPPQASLKGEDCSLIFRQGRIGLYSSDGSLIIESSLDLMNKVAGASVERPWDLHRNTAGINFGLDLTQFLDEVRKRGNLIEKEIRGDQGDTGDRGDAGRDQLDTGPVGPTGVNGLNSPFDGSIIEETLNVEVDATDEPRAVVDVSTEEVSDSENYLVFTRANVGNPDACPSEVIPKAITSPWILVVQPGVANINKRTTLTDDCGIPCAVCSSSIYYINIEPILSQIFDRFKDRILALKEAKEDLVAEWLKSMVFLFNQQKAALCCALENCRSRTRNVATRQYIEQQRIQAAIGNFSLVVDGAEDKLTVDLDEVKECLQAPQSGPYIKENLGAGCDDWLYELTIDASVHNRDPRNAGNSNCLVFNLPRGQYFMQIIGCCAQLGEEASTGIALGEIARDEQGNIIEVGDVFVDGAHYFGEPVPGDPTSIYVFDENGNRKKVKTEWVGNPEKIGYSTRKGFSGGIQYSGRVAMLYQQVISMGTDTEKYQANVIQFPNLGLFGDSSASRSAYLGLSVTFTHAGGDT
jgi:hypothetical protein